MTTTTETTGTKKEKQAPDFYLFEQVAGSKDSKIVGAVYRHKKGNGLNVLMNGKRYSAFAPKPKPAPAQQPAAEGKGA